MRATFIASTLALCLFCCSTASYSDDLAEAVQAQSKINDIQQNHVAEENRSRYITQNAPLIVGDMVLQFYRQASKAGVKFESVNVSPTEDRGGLSYSMRVLKSEDNGNFKIIEQCFLNCDIFPAINLSGGDRSLVSVYVLPDPNVAETEKTCSDGNAAMSCLCEISIFNDNRKVLCGDLFDPKRREAVTRDTVAWMKQSLSAYLKGISHDD
ncbi:hypothetical protein OKW41_006127 [Paraburkholderia sp. UCT70]|uniref:hypothetical protein n=1 Tax=Paraburkholderia sp. UCT70 TaxID=2991068 RepID=UPI003D258765